MIVSNQVWSINISIGTINRTNFLHKYLDLEFIIEHLYKVLSISRTSASCAES